MVKTRIIPCLLLKNGRCVKGVNFTNHRDVGHPVTNAKIYEAQGADELIFLDIIANSKESLVLLDIVRQTADQCFMPLTVGGGIKTLNDIFQLLRAGADKVSINTAAVQNPEFITQATKKFGSQCIVVSIDYKKNQNGNLEVFIQSGNRATGLKPVDWAKKVQTLGAGEILLTNIDREGTRTGYDLETLRAVSEQLNIPVIANGGVGSMADLKRGILDGHAQAVSLASILHFTNQSVIKARDYLATSGLEVRVDDLNIQVSK
ncbi:MAG: imidazole glycerol phosphate synthase subunit HisF [Candidatus Buchananbacteria bacterium RIFCSPHIGHO2_01_FULL_39_14]|uniref:imidazole glycerol-phosphate synthase n=1 Tax=Candidatus Buchananbacteria bacterium RIFCSPHIGHO2_01_FULL_39_14 TaxID=1797532 RepID=A0A1G1XXT9_9BACT|nr:MAG: imidazole glycerol phosphate synthase subunit HisF [Candidatus Buchananbacteria bacterium RIFCSPHIGHO2_01_FULL_39_14]OGY48658.1 MAG: imidazole glycerol phosphate synthase subunit HisF [Candidatus Buchananbacteria bacterium RIFCSPHIGHO2_02_FULL_39_17]